MPIVAMPDGAQVQFPDDMPSDQIRSLIVQKFPELGRQQEREQSIIPRAISDIPAEIAGAAGENIKAIKEGFAGDKAEQGTIGGLVATGKGILAIPGLAMSPITGAARSLLGHPLADAEHAIGTVVNPEVAARDNADEMYANAKSGVDKAMMAAAPSRGGLQITVRPSSPPSPPATGPLGVTLSEGQATRDLGAIQREQVALRAPSGAAGERAKEFAAQQAQQVQSARDRVARGFDQFGQRVVETPQEAGQLVQQSVQQEAAARKADVANAYDRAKALPGDIDSGAFNDIATSIKTDLSSRPDPVVIDDKLTPFASHAIKDVEQRIANLQIQNRASPAGQPPQNQIAGITLQGVDQMRRRLSAFRSDAFRSGNSADGRAAQGVIDAFDSHIDQAINNGAFRGDPRAVQAWNAARAAHADYKSAFGKGKNDPVGRVVERILGTKENPAAIPNDVADFMYGSSGVNPNSLNVAVANRIKGILGDKSPEWSAVKQGLFSRLAETPQGVTDFGPGKIAQRLRKFMDGDGKELSDAVFSPAERSLMRQYADLHRALEVPQAGANWSNTSTVLMPMLKKVSAGFATLVGGVLGHVAAPGMYGAGEVIGGAITGKVGSLIKDASDARKIMRQMPLAVEATKKWQKALAAYNKANTPPSRVALSVATSNWARSLKPLGIDLASVAESPGVSTAQDQPEIPRPPGQ